MKRLAVVVEGDGDFYTFPSLIANVGRACGMHIIAPDPIRAGNNIKLNNPGQIEKFADLAASRPDIDLVLIIVDLDDGCPVTWHRNFTDRCIAAKQKYNKQIEVCFIVREFEAWLLHNLDRLKIDHPEIAWNQDFTIVDPTRNRGAKEILAKAMKRRYRETTDQLVFTRSLNTPFTFSRDRSFRRFVKIVTGLEYSALGLLLSEDC